VYHSVKEEGTFLDASACQDGDMSQAFSDNGISVHSFEVSDQAQHSFAAARLENAARCMHPGSSRAGC
jgi:hypothetical protein